MNDPLLSHKLEQARKEHQAISYAIIRNDTPTLLLQYGSLTNAYDRLQQLEYFLNHRQEKPSE